MTLLFVLLMIIVFLIVVFGGFQALTGGSLVNQLMLGMGSSSVVIMVINLV